MALKLLVVLASAALSTSTSTSSVSINLAGSSVSYKNDHVPQHHPSHPAPGYHHPDPVYHPKPAPPYHPEPAYPAHPPKHHPAPPAYPAHPPKHHPAPHHPAPHHPAPYAPAHPAPYHPAPAPYHPSPSHKPEPAIPSCSELTNNTWCLEDEEYPEYDIIHAIEYHLDKFNSLYADVADLDTSLSVERPETLEEETYLCPSETSYIRPLRAQNTDGKWRIIVNEIKLHYKEFTQSVRIEECQTSGEACPLVPHCYESTCLQKSAYHRFLVYDAYDKYFPFAIETFKLPASCACFLGAYIIDH